MEFCDEKTPLVKDWAYYIKWVVEDQILLSAQKQTQNRLETQIRLKKQVGTSSPLARHEVCGGDGSGARPDAPLALASRTSSVDR